MNGNNGSNGNIGYVRSKHEEKMSWIWKLQDFNRKVDLRVATTIDGRRIGMWIPLKDWLDISYIDHVTVLPNECVWEIDHDDWTFVRKYSEKILAALDRFEVPHVQGPTSGRGFHIHAYFTFPNHIIRKEANDYGLLPRDLRLTLFNLVCDEARIPSNMIGKGLAFDTGCVDFSDLSMGHMVRAFGGRKFENGYVVGHKTYTEDVPKERIRVLKFADVRIPELIVPYHIPKKLIEDALLQMEKKKQEALKHSCCIQDGLYLDAPCIKELLKSGLKRGHRCRGGQLIAIACKLSGLRIEVAEEVARVYFENCEKGNFEFSELLGWLRWAYSRDVDWRCSQGIPFGYCQPHRCGVAQMKMPGMNRGPANPVWLRKWQRAPTVGWMQRKGW